MTERMFASEDESLTVSRFDLNGRGDNGRGDTPDDAQVGVARRLQARLDRHLWLLRRIESDPLTTAPPGLDEVLDLGRRMRRDTESLLLLCGQEPGVRVAGHRRVQEVLSDAAAAAEEPRRVDVRNPVAAGVAPAAATELLHVLAELIDHVTAVYPGARVEVSSRTEVLGGLAVDIKAEGAGRYDPDGLGGRRALAAAQRLARRSRHGLDLRLPPATTGLVASVHLPGAVVVLDEPERSGLSWAGSASAQESARALSPRNGSSNGNGPTNGSGNGPTNGNGQRNGNGSGNGSGSGNFDALFGSDINGTGARTPALPTRPAPYQHTQPPMPLQHSQPTPLQHSQPTPLQHSQPTPLQRSQPVPIPVPPQSRAASPPLPRPRPDAPGQVDELFGPLVDIAGDAPAESIATPIFEAIASAWFVDEAQAGANGAAGSPGGEWDSPGDVEWREAAARASRPDPEPQTDGSLPRRRPGSQLVPPPRSQTQPDAGPAERVPDRVRERLSTYQRGLREGRHRAEPPQARTDRDPFDPEAW